MAEEKVIILSLETGQAASSINDLEKNLKTLKGELKTLDAGGDAWNAVLEEIVKNQRQLNEVNKQVTSAIKGHTDEINASVKAQQEKEKIEERQLDTIKSLRGEISGYRDSLLNLTEGSEEYNTALAEIDTRQQRINEALSAGKVVTEKQTSAFRELQKDIKGYRDELVLLERGSEEYTAVINKIGEAQGRLNDINDDARIAALTLGEQLGNVIKLNSQIAAGFSSVLSLTSLFGELGKESEILNGIMVKLQASIALVQGLQGLTGLTKTFPLVTQSVKGLSSSLTGLKATLVSTGIGALAVGIGLLVSNFDKLTGAFQRNKKALNDLNKEYDDYKAQTSYLQREANLQIEILKIKGASEEEILKERRKNLQDEYDRLLEQQRKYQAQGVSSLKGAAKENYEAIQEALKQNREAIDNWLDDDRLARERANQRAIDDEKKAEEERLKAAEQAADERRRIYQSELSEIEKINQSVSLSNLSASEKQIYDLNESYQTQFALLEKYGRDTTALTEKFNSDLDAIIQSERERQSQETAANFEEQINLTRERNEQLLNEQHVYLASLEEQRLQAELSGDDESIEEIQTRINEAIALQQEQNILFLEEYRFTLEQVLQDETLIGEQRVNLERELQDTENSIALEGVNYRNLLLNQELKAKQEQKKAEDKILKEKLQSQQQNLGQTAQLLSAASDLIGENTAAGKVAAIAAATIDTYRAGTLALSSFPPPFSYAALATTIATGLATVKKIASTDVPGASGMSVPTPRIVSINSVSGSTPTVTPLTEEEINPDINERFTTISSTEDKQINNRVYVSETDIVSTINRVEAKEDSSDF